MKKIYLNSIVCLFVCLFSINLQAKEVNKQTAEKVAINAFAELDNNKNASDFQVKEILTVKSEETTSFYIVNFKPTGFIILSASDAAGPILGSSTESNFSFKNLPPQLSYLLDSYKAQIKEIEKQKISPTKEIKQKWDKYTEATSITSISLKSASATLSQVSPLIQTRWGQGAGWNRFCPGIVGGPNGRGLVGCTAVAFAQVLNYWDCKVNESGLIVDSNYNNLSVNLTESDYLWSYMGLTSSDDYNARLLYDCALATQTVFGASASSGYPDAGIYAFINNYGFKTSIIIESSTSDNAWTVKLKNELNIGRPIIYIAEDTVYGAHAWVIDGYDSNDNFHCNWGWPDSNVDGYYSINDLSPLYFNFSPNHWAISNIEPVMPNCEEVNGSCFVSCNGTSYNMPNLPYGATITWEKSSNITRVSAQSSNPCIFQSNGSGSGWIEATINYNGSATLDRKDVWVGTPALSSVSGPSYLGTYQPAYFFTEFSCTQSGPDSYVWGTSPLPGVTITSYGNYASIMFTQPGYYQVVAKAHNVCGWSDYVIKMVIVSSGYSMAISPNPSTGETTIELVNDNNEALTALTEWDLDIYDTMQRIKEKKIKIKDKQTKLNTSSWKDGVYIVRAKIGDETISEKLVVKH